MLLWAFIHNVSDENIRLISANIQGPGVGEVITVTRMAVAPLPPLVGPGKFTPGGIYTTDPPGLLAPGDRRCSMQTIVPVRGFVLPPDGEARLAVFIRATGLGDYDIETHVVEYAVGRSRYRQTLRYESHCSVSSQGRPVSLEPAQRACVEEAGPL